jgi:hypothetical protein
MGRDLKVHFFRSKEEYNNGDYRYSDHEDDFSLNGKRNTALPWEWSGSYFDLVNYIAEEAEELREMCIIKEHSSNDDKCNECDSDEYDDEPQQQKLDCEAIQEKSELIGYLGLILSESSINEYIVIQND